jgi:hypothetical protein
VVNTIGKKSENPGVEQMNHFKKLKFPKIFALCQAKMEDINKTHLVYFTCLKKTKPSSFHLR